MGTQKAKGKIQFKRVPNVIVGESMIQGFKNNIRVEKTGIRKCHFRHEQD